MAFRFIPPAHAAGCAEFHAADRFHDKAGRAWDGRATIEVVSQVANLAAMQAHGAGELKFEWSARLFAVINEIAWSQDTLLVGANGLAALTFCEVPILTAKPSPR